MRVIDYDRVVEAMAAKYPSYKKVTDDLDAYVFDYDEEAAIYGKTDPQVEELQRQLNETIEEANKKLKALNEENEFLKDTLVRTVARLTH